jgi:hypothetical protein
MFGPKRRIDSASVVCFSRCTPDLFIAVACIAHRILMPDEGNCGQLRIAAHPSESQYSAF